MRANGSCGVSLGLAVVALAALGCDDDGGGSPDAGSGLDGGADAPAIDASPDVLDASIDADAATETPCDPRVADACPTDEKCAVVIETLDGSTYGVRFDCVPKSTGQASSGVQCTRGIDATPDNDTDNVTTDNCRQGYFCWDDNLNTTYRTCRKLCGFEGATCAVNEFCATVNSDPFLATCFIANGCDPFDQTGCAASKSCYVVQNTSGDALGTCFEFDPPDGGAGLPGDDCDYINNCGPGSQCFPEILADGGVGETAACRTLCGAGPGTAADAGATDAGVDASADGGSIHECDPSLDCVAIPTEPDASTRIAFVPGVCQ